MGLKSPEDELEEFLVAQPSWLRKVLQLDYSLSREELLAWQSSDWWWQDTRGKVEDEFLRLLQRCPDRWRAYCERRREDALSNVPSVSPGRPRKDALAYEAIELQKSGLSYAKIAAHLNRKYGRDTTTPGAIRFLIGSRKRGPM